MDRCTMTGPSGVYADRCAGFAPDGRPEEPSYTVRNPYGAADNRFCPCRECDLSHADQLPLGMGYVPVQEWQNTYDTQTALCRGSLFPELYKPFAGSRGERYVR